MRYVPALDGFRAVAVMLVFLHHTAHFPGWLGSDIFFVISGFLITSILIAEHETAGKISLLYFYFRRTCRLLPALLIVIFVAVGMALWLHSKEHDTTIDAIAALFYVLNYHYVAMVNLDQHWTALSHLWSLSVEEQFYIIWPPLLILLLKWNRKLALQTVLVGAVIIFCWRNLLFFISEPPRYHIYFALDTRADELMIGCALALWQGRSKVLQFLKPIWPAIVLSLAIVVVKLEPNELLMPWSFFLIGLAIASIIIIIMNDERCLLTKMLSVPPVVAFGRISYGFYLWHFLIISEPAIYNRFVLSRTLMSFIVTLILALTSYYCIERPIVTLGKVKRRAYIMHREKYQQSINDCAETLAVVGSLANGNLKSSSGV